MVGTMHSISALIASMAMPWAVPGANLPDVGVINGVGLKWNVISAAIRVILRNKNAASPGLRSGRSGTYR